MNHKLRQAFQKQRANAKLRGIAFEMTFQEWYDVWERSGKLELRGCGADKYVMARYGDVGPYAVSNVEIVTNSKNVKDSYSYHPRSLFDLRSKQIGTGRGWTLVDGKYQVTVSKKYIGRFLTEQDAVKAYKQAADAFLADAMTKSISNPLASDDRGGGRE